jgi:hypothetical protein
MNFDPKGFMANKRGKRLRSPLVSADSHYSQ